jgi:hypothetical protein
MAVIAAAAEQQDDDDDKQDKTHRNLLGVFAPLFERNGQRQGGTS